jgi:uncharacterized membrane protein YhaH (DUF805 family)
VESLKRDFLDHIFKRIFLFSGRARRREFWMFEFWAYVGYMILWALFVFGSAASVLLRDCFMIAWMIYILALIVPSLSLGVRRLHDVGLSGWLLLLNLAPPVGQIALLVLACLDSQHGDNKYGPNPKGIIGTMVLAR